MTEVPIIQKAVRWFTKQINEKWFLHDADLRHESYVVFKNIPLSLQHTKIIFCFSAVLKMIARDSDFKQKAEPFILADVEVRNILFNACVDYFQ